MPNRRRLIYLIWLVVLVGMTACTPTSPRIPPMPTETHGFPPPLTKAWWQPEPGLKWQIQYEGELVLQEGVQVYNLDLFETESEMIERIHERGAKTICYFSAGTLEDWVPDRDQFPKSLLGSPYPEWPGETWLDIGNLASLLPLMEARIALCAQKGFDAIDPDNLDGWQNQTGFALTRDQTLSFAKALAELAHKNNLAIGLKNNPELVDALLTDVDFMVIEEAFEQGWFEEVLPFLEVGKAVFAVEYTEELEVIEMACLTARDQQFSLVFKRLNLDAEVRFCQ